MLRLIYRLYEFRLRRQIDARPVPGHVGIILEGNRRYARQRGFSDPRKAYDLGAEKLDDVLIWCTELGIPAVTLWVCSIDNLRRPWAEVSGILAAVEAKIGGLAQDPAIHRRRIRVKAAGRIELLPPSTVAAIRRAEEATTGYGALTLTIAIAYGGREEITDAVRDLVRDKARHGADFNAIVEEITPSAIDKHLYTAGLPDPDLIIRTSGEIRLSGFLLWQSTHSEFYFSDCQLAGVPQNRLSSGSPRFSAAKAALRAVRPFPSCSRRREHQHHLAAAAKDRIEGIELGGDIQPEQNRKAAANFSFDELIVSSCIDQIGRIAK